MKKKQKNPLRAPSKPALIRSDDLCKRLVIMAAFALADNPQAQMLVYKAVRQLQLLDAEAIKAGILLRDD